MLSIEKVPHTQFFSWFFIQKMFLGLFSEVLGLETMGQIYPKSTKIQPNHNFLVICLKIIFSTINAM